MLPRQIVRKVISKFTDKTITTQGNERINQVTSMFFEQVMGDLNAYAEHAGRDVVISGDVELLMHRQGQLSDTSSVEALAHDFLPRELYDRICVSALANNELYPDKEDDWI
ncbi:hypothetical protein BCR43DRAFT_296462 [Syncephalastrum racemosum]|uniref:CENP-T/Histone H4 histone fold domain-containing protein n=1 Tax=Syncephalastrum racemosum TaxID=13706 RepID=A0A1X2H9B8_SYNRA|nr:hypothetical protein BCR43DRAFT_296462 [Syncephalastrum racemosum]